MWSLLCCLPSLFYIQRQSHENVSPYPYSPLVSAAALGPCKAILRYLLQMSENEGSYYPSLCVMLTYRFKGKCNTLVLLRGTNACVFIVTLSILILFRLTPNDSRVWSWVYFALIFPGSERDEGSESLALHKIQSSFIGGG